MKNWILILSALFLSSCFAGGGNFEKISTPQNWTAHQTDLVKTTQASALKNWWLNFQDPALNTLVELTLADSPDKLIAEARILEARGVRRTARSALFPQLGASASGGQQDTGIANSDDFYEAKFDASFELDIFGKNRKNLDAANAQIENLEAQYHDVNLTLIAEVTRSYIAYRAFQKQARIAKKNLEIQKKTLELINLQKEFGEAPQLDVERARSLVNTTRASIPEFERLSQNAKLQLTTLTGALPQSLETLLSQPTGIPGNTAQAVLLAPAEVLSFRPDIRAASANLSANTALAESVTAELFPSFSLGGFYGITENVLTGSTGIWNAALSAAVALLDFGAIEGRIDAARAREKIAYQQYRKTVLEAVTEVETALNDTSRINQQFISLQRAYQNAEKAFVLSQTLYREGELSFLDILDAQRTVNEADSAMVAAESAKAESLVRLYKSLGIY